MEQCKEVMSQLKRQQHTRQHITLMTLSPDSLLTVLININECLVKELEIVNTPFDFDCVSQLARVVTFNKTVKYLYLRSSPLLPDTYHLLTTALSSNDTLKSLHLLRDHNITDKDIPHICDFITTNITLQYLSLTSCHNITKYGIQQIQNVIVNNKSLTSLSINNIRLR